MRKLGMPVARDLERSDVASTAKELFPTPTEVASDVEETANDGYLGLPKLDAVAERSAKRKKKKKDTVGGRGGSQKRNKPRLEKFDREAYTRALEVDPNADADPDLIRQSDVDIFAITLGEGADTFFGIDSAYLQIGHLALFLTLILAAFVYEPSFPLTAAPVEYRDFIKQGLAVTIIINAATAYLAFREAEKRGQPQLFWLLKSFFIGGIAVNQLRTGTKPPPKDRFKGGDDAAR